MRNLLFAFFLSATTSLAQSITIPAQTISTPLTINGTTVQISITIPSQTVALPAAGPGLPPGMTYSQSAGLTVTGGVTASGAVTGSELAVTGGSAVPTCSSGLYLLQYTASTNMLTPACYTPTSIPAITVSQAASGAITLTP
jgi:hypothetical protein